MVASVGVLIQNFNTAIAVWLLVRSRLAKREERSADRTQFRTKARIDGDWKSLLHKQNPHLCSGAYAG